MILLIIDPQDDFHVGYKGHPRQKGFGALAVNGSVDDSDRIIKFLPKFEKVYVSLDTHTENHIGHHGFWKRIDNGKIEEIQGRPLFIGDGEKIIAIDGESKIEIEAKDENLREYAKNYVKGVHEKEKNEGLGKLPMCWPTHCILGEAGHDIYGPLKQELQKHSVEYFVKGQNELAEMYSIFRSEVQPKDIGSLPEIYNSGLRYKGQPDDKSTDSGKVDIDNIKKSVGSTPYLTTDYNKNVGSLLNKLMDSDKDVYICGEALSHCVNYSLRDFAEYASKHNFKKKIKLVMNASSCVVLPFENKQKLFYGNIVKLIDDIKKKENGLGLVDIVFWNGEDFIENDEIVDFIKIFYDGKSDYSEESYKSFKKEIQELLKKDINYMKHTASSLAKIKKGGKRRRTRKRSKRTKRRSQRKQKRSQRKRTRRSRR